MDLFYTLYKIHISHKEEVLVALTVRFKRMHATDTLGEGKFQLAMVSLPYILKQETEECPSRIMTEIRERRYDNKICLRLHEKGSKLIN